MASSRLSALRFGSGVAASVIALAALSTLSACAQLVPAPPVEAAAAITGLGHSRSGQGYLGVVFHDVPADQVGSLHLHDVHGAEITYLDHDGPACKAGMRERDVVLSVNGVAIQNEDQLRHLLHDTKPGKGLSIVISRDGAQQTIGVVLGDREELLKQAWKSHFVVPEPAPPRDEYASDSGPDESPAGANSFSGDHLSASIAYTGANLDPVGAQLAQYFGIPGGKGLLIHGVDNNSPAALAGLHAGDVITRIDNRPVAALADWYRALRDSKGRPLQLTVMRDHHEQTLTFVSDPRHRSSLNFPGRAHQILEALLLR